jgi:hypothetical protein
MNFEKISDKKFGVFKKSEVVNPILISGGAYDTTGQGTWVGQHDKIGTTGNGPVDGDGIRTMDGQNYTQDGATTSDETDVT